MKPLSIPKTHIQTRQIPAEGTTPKDELIAKNWQREQYIGITILFISLIAAVGFLSRRFEYAVLLALILSIALIVLFINL
ncbi:MULTISPECIES: hypothetical protein [unclassified Anabaena]|uniref:hypothetical protein n=1 Tax=unclassified Anabaena TaxID=2619674 RepID=UPI000836E619|nr:MULTISPECIES: hypothetical protein [unclassified Anabaena]